MGCPPVPLKVTLFMLRHLKNRSFAGARGTLYPLGNLTTKKTHGQCGEFKIYSIRLPPRKFIFLLNNNLPTWKSKVVSKISH